MIRIFLVDDHELIRHALATSLERSDDLELAGEASNVADAIRGITEAKPDIAVVDLQLGSDSGITICETIRDRHPHVRSLVLTGSLDEGLVMRVVAAGASGYLLKVAPMAEILDAIREVAAGGTVLAGAAAEAAAAAAAGPGAPERELSEQENRILDLVAAGLTNRQIARRLDIAEQTVKNHVSKLLQKLGVESRTQAAVYATQRRSRQNP